MLRVVLCTFFLMSSAEAVDPANCTLGGFNYAEGTVLLGTPAHTVPVKRYSEPCGLLTRTPGTYVTDITPAGILEHGARFYFMADSAPQGRAILMSGLRQNATALYSIAINAGRIELLDHTGRVLGSNASRLNGWNSVEVRWQSGSPGTISMTTSHLVGDSTGGRTVSAEVYGRAGTSGDRIHSVVLGYIAGPAGGVFNFDAYESRNRYAERATQLCRCDANSDGVVNSTDLTFIKSELLHGSMALGQPDCDENGVVNNSDGIVAQQLITAGRSACPGFNGGDTLF